MPHRPPPDVGLGDLAHLHRGLHPRLEALALHRVLERQGVDDRGEQSHVVGGRAVEAGALGELHAPDDIASAHDDGDVHPFVSDGLDLARHQVQHLRVDPRPARARQRLAAQLEEDAPVGGPRRSGHHSPNRKRANRRTWMFSPVLAITPLMRSPPSSPQCAPSPRRRSARPRSRRPERPPARHTGGRWPSPARQCRAPAT